MLSLWSSVLACCGLFKLCRVAHVTPSLLAPNPRSFINSVGQVTVDIANRLDIPSSNVKRCEPADTVFDS